jgi:hypothetical protein
VLRYRWCILRDHRPFDLVEFLVSPYWGILLSSKKSGLTRVRSLGFREKHKVPSLNTSHTIHEGRRVTKVEGHVSRVRQLQRRYSFLHRFLPMYCLVWLSLGYRRTAPTQDSFDSVAVALEDILGLNNNGTCVVDSLVRCHLLNGTPGLTLNLGVFVPTDLMHAWVEIDGIAIHECPDILAHYRKAVEYSAIS